MQPNTKLEVKAGLQQQLTMNADLLQSLEVLRLPMQELEEFLVQKSYDNPLLEMDEPFLNEAAPEAETPLNIESEMDDSSNGDAAWREGAADKDAYLAAHDDSEESFQKVLERQLGALRLDAEFAKLCGYLISCLDRRGYFVEYPEEIADLLGCSQFDVMQALYVIQSLEPAGVGARNIEECLLLQLMHGDAFNQYTIRLVKDGMHLLAKKDFYAIARLLQADDALVREACCAVRALNPIPSQGYFTGEKHQYLIPDVMVEKDGNQLSVVYNSRRFPSLRINHQYAAMMQERSDPDTVKYLKENLNEAKQLIKAVGRRESTIVQIVGKIVQLQQNFFSDGMKIVPMTLADIADSLNMTISTVSRAVSDKYLKCAAGTLEIRSLFTKGMKNDEGAHVSVATIKSMIQHFIEAEDKKKPLSDRAIGLALEVAKVRISRRTVAKYREDLKIPGSQERKNR